jgi:hypothetical protein
MERRMRILRKLVLSFALIAGFSSLSFAQFGVSIGPSIMRNFGAPKTNFGFHVQGELSENDEQSMFARLGFYPGRSAIGIDSIYLTPLDQNNFNYPYAKFAPKTSFITLDGGYRTYIGDGYEFGFSAYGGTTLGLVYASVKMNLEDFDRTEYKLPENFKQSYQYLGLAAGLSGGVKYGFPPIGTFYLDAGLKYVLLDVASDLNVFTYSTYIRQRLYVNVELGIRRDLLW